MRLGGDFLAHKRRVKKARAGKPWPLIRSLFGKVLKPDEVIADPGRVHRMREAGERFVVFDHFQRDMIASIFSPDIREVYVKGNTGSGKNGATGPIVIAYLFAWPDARIILTRDSDATAKAVTLGEIVKWWERLPADFPTRHRYQTQSNGIMERQGNVMRVRVANPRSEEGFKGTHGQHIFFLFDEATAESLAPRFGLAQTQMSKFLAIANPSVTSGPFRTAFDLAEDPDVTQTVLGPYGYRRLITIDGRDMINVRAKCCELPIGPPARVLVDGEVLGGLEHDGETYRPGEPLPEEVQHAHAAIIPGQTCYDKWLGHCLNPDDRWVRVMARGKFPDGDPAKQVVPGTWITRNPQRDRAKAGPFVRGPYEFWRKVVEMRARVALHVRKKRPRSGVVRAFDRIFPLQAGGLDVGMSQAGDPCILTVGGSAGILDQHEYRSRDSVEIVEWVIDTWRDEYGIDICDGGHPIGIDADGVGAGLTGIFKSKGVKVIELRGNDTSDVDSRVYGNKRAEMYGEFGKRLDPAGEWKYQPFALPPVDMLRADLVAIERMFRQDGICWLATPKRKIPGVELKVLTVVEKLGGRSPDRGDSAVLFYRALQTAGATLEDWLEGTF